MKRPQKSRQKPSIAIIVPSEGVPAGPWKMSKLEDNEPEEVPLGGIKVKEANKNWTRVRTIGGSCSKKIRMAIVSYIGHDLRIVDANWNGLTEALEVDLFVPVVDLSVRRDACPPSPPFDIAAPFCPYDMSAFPLAYPL
jgi:hypothetical protein